MKEFTISQLVGMIKKDWGNEINSRAIEYLSAIEQLNESLTKDNEKLIIDFLCSAISWRGNLAAEIKKELNRRLSEIR
jgi:hypothetical protein